MPPTKTRGPILDAAGVEDALERLAREILAGREAGDLVLVGIRRRGVELADRIAARIREATGTAVPTGSLDITLYRDDFARVGPMPIIGTTEIPVDITDRRVVIVDDVLFSGRTIRAALHEIMDFGRPRRIELCVLVDRGGRELPIQPDHVGVRIDTGPGDHVIVRVPEIDGDLSVSLVDGEGTA
ncbi:MAG: bifunctional pyr operon transcriptional regulator/uracil phosphoribosyltransferase PyrR [Gemmatimonadota bacterium]